MGFNKGVLMKWIFGIGSIGLCANKIKQIFALVSISILGACDQSVPPPASPISPPAVTDPAPVVEVQPAEEPAPEAAASADVTDVSEVVQDLYRQMKDKKALQDKLWAAANAINDYNHVGTYYNEYHIPEHSCYVLGRLLKQDKYIAGTVMTYDPDYVTATTENAQDLRVMAVSLSNFNSVANGIIGQAHHERVIEWNLDCVGRFGIPRDASIEQVGQSSFYVIRAEGRVLQVLGDIEKGFAQKVSDAVEANPKVEQVALGSGGGYVLEAIAAGRYIRSKGLETSLWNNCYSACPLVFMGGVERVNWSPYGDLGFHQVADENGTAVPVGHPIYQAIFNYTSEMGVDPTYVLKRMWSSPPSGMTMVEGQEDELCDARIITWVQRGCSKPN
ncbi:hypothetical protein [Stenotrophomonas maltophilia]|nr:hypothetical protein [Stenotrophomonas maltophilia]WNV16804.1 hypothetical protein RS400_09750 [Stenotrophomonas maltophilia]